MEQTHKKSKLTYKTLFIYSLVVMALLIISLPVFAHKRLTIISAPAATHVQLGQSPQLAQGLEQGMQVNRLESGTDTWYLYQHPANSTTEYVWLSLNLRYQTKGEIQTGQVNFELIPQHQVDDTSSHASLLTQGQATTVSLPDQDLTQLLWTGQMTNNEPYYIHVFNNSGLDLDYTLEAEVEQPAFSGAIPASYSDSSSQHDAALPPRTSRQLSWSLIGQAVAGMSATEAGQWMQTAQSIGWISPQGMPIKAAPTEADPTLVWGLVGQAIAGLEAEEASNWLQQADALGWLAVLPSLPMHPMHPMLPMPPNHASALSTQSSPTDLIPETETTILPDSHPQVKDYTPINIYPNNPLPFNIEQVNSGRLAPYGVHWYSLTLHKVNNQEWIENFAMTMFTTPSDGFIDSRVNFEIFPANQYHIWARGETNYMEHFGLGMWLSRDEDRHTGERLWSGSLVDGDRYFVKVKNSSPELIDYYLFAGDINNAELGNPTLHQLDGGQITAPYALDPATRPRKTQ
ncbi:hypothetical protein QUF58_14980 [Anaerolineales bacterium HSG24]|nr:hypothetical protein [Anaerolineales bacterium HSG24]